MEGEARKIGGYLSEVGKVRLGPYDICDQVCGTVLLEFCGTSKGEFDQLGRVSNEGSGPVKAHL